MNHFCCWANCHNIKTRASALNSFWMCRRPPPLRHRAVGYVRVRQCSDDTGLGGIRRPDQQAVLLEFAAPPVRRAFAVVANLAEDALEVRTW